MESARLSRPAEERGNSVTARVSWVVFVCFRACGGGGLWGPADGMMLGSQYVAADGPAWASPRSLGSRFGVQAGLCLRDPPPLYRSGPTWPGPTRALFCKRSLQVAL
ncbi:unnamed protein product [Prunus armeniaca]|uniref:Uncharacterized protein n=1 Tax=Prunus armeniaca TaxID=36596 RepID=A0A6J5UUB8_PRUAR|nr:hypothetical protein GBA52_015745 [Prunus armeniaca]CAB4279621.1 unnamed protein product [Prunus armeniaca]CAB4310084.1 unnamed protein product [Prunus armeniaca]